MTTQEQLDEAVAKLHKYLENRRNPENGPESKRLHDEVDRLKDQLEIEKRQRER